MRLFEQIKNKKVMLILVFLLLVVGVGEWCTSHFLPKNEVISKKTAPMVSIGGYDGWQYGTWEITGVLASNSPGYEVSSDGTYLTATYLSDSLEENEVELTTWGTLDNQSLLLDLQKGEAVFHFPLYLFYNIDISYPSSYDDENNRVVFTDNDGNMLGYVALAANIPYCDETQGMDCSSLDGEFYWSFNEFELLVYNNTDILSSAENNYNFNLDIVYSFAPSEIVMDTENFAYPYVSFADTDYGDLAFFSTILTSSTSGGISLDMLSSKEEVVFDHWQAEWGVESTPYDFYVQYNIDGIIDYAGNYSVSYSPEFTEGDIVGYSCDGNTFQLTVDGSTCENSYASFSPLSYSLIVGYHFDEGQQSKVVSMTIPVSASTSTDSSTKQFDWYFTHDKEEINTIDYPVGISTTITQSLDSDTSGIGAINSLYAKNNVAFDWLLESGTHTINQSGTGVVKAFNLWNLTANGQENYTVELGSHQGMLDTSYNTLENPFYLENDYVIRSFYPQDDREYNYLLSNDTYLLDLVTDVTSYTEKEVYIQINGGDYELIGSYKKDANGLLVYTASDSRTISNSHVTESNPVTLPDGVTSILVRYTGKRAAVYLGIHVQTELKASENVLNQIDLWNQQDVLLKNEGLLKVNDDESSKITGTYLTKLTANTFVDSVGSVNAKVGTSDSVTYTSHVYEQVNCDSESLSVAKKVINEQNGSTFYVLLPEGSTLDGNVRVLKYGSDEEVSYQLSQSENYAGSGRTLLTVQIETSSENNFVVLENAIQSGYTIVYTVSYSPSSNQIYGNILYHDLAYVSNGLLSDGYLSASGSSSVSFSTHAVQNIFDNLLGVSSEKKQIFATNSVVLDKITITSGSYTKSTKNEIETSYNSQTEIVEGGEYRYRLQYAFTSSYEEITNVVFVDKLENSFGTNSYFKGILEEVDVRYLTGLGAHPTVYYTTSDVSLEQVDFNDGLWSTSKPSDMSKVVAVAVDCGDYVFTGSEAKSLMVDFVMKASNAYSDSIKAYNQSFLYYNRVGSSETKMVKTDITEVSLQKATISLEATSSVGVGSPTNPSLIEKDLSYEIRLQNTSSIYDYDALTLKMRIPKGLEITDVLEESSLADSVTGTYTFDEETRILSYQIPTLKENELKTITIPVSIVLEDISSDEVLVSEVTLDKLENMDYSGESISLYHQLQVPILEFGKYANTSDTSDFSDVSTMLIQKGEVYSYRVHVQNTSSVSAREVQIVDTVPSGLSVDEDSITHEGVYHRDKGTITWILSELEANTSVNLEYSVQVANDISLGTLYKSSAHVSLVHPIDANSMLYDEDTNIVSTLYQIVSDLKVTNQVEGLLADKTKAFAYTISFVGKESDAGNYDVVDANAKKVGTLVIDEEGKGSYSVSLVGGESITIQLLPGDMKYKIQQTILEGYTVQTSTSSTTDDHEVVVEGITTEERLNSYIFTNTYDVSTTASIGAKVTYDRSIEAGMFQLQITDNNGYVDQKEVSVDGTVSFDTLKYSNVKGQFTYIVRQVNTGIKKVAYDTNTYKVVVNITDDGQGTLNKTIAYYNKQEEEVSEMVFQNVYVPNGLVIQNVNRSVYVDETKEFVYELTLSGSSGTYKVVDQDNQELESVVIGDDGSSSYSFSLHSDEKINILDLPNGTKYTIVQKLVPYYSTDVENLSYRLDTEQQVILHEGTIEEDTIQVLFNNSYQTIGEFQPEAVIQLENKGLENEEFQFMIRDISSGSSNGYTDYMRNDADGHILFSTISYYRPGTYVYEITQVAGTSNHIYYDLSKCLLTLQLEDNGDGTMKVVSSTYQYSDDRGAFLNRYSVDPIVKEEIKNPEDSNPNTHDRVVIISILLGIVIVLFIVEGRMHLKKYEMKI